MWVLGNSAVRVKHKTHSAERQLEPLLIAQKCKNKRDEEIITRHITKFESSNEFSGYRN